MTQEDKELLLKDLCARLPYGVRIKYSYSTFLTYKLTYEILKGFEVYGKLIIPYLRPISSMTEEEKAEFYKLKQFSVTVIMPNGVSLLKPTYIVDLEEDGEGLNHLYDWLNAHHFDYRNLIEKGLALEASKDMYKI